MKLADIVNRVTIGPRNLTDYALTPDLPWGYHMADLFHHKFGFI
jgi:hypothetical protein